MAAAISLVSIQRRVGMRSSSVRSSISPCSMRIVAVWVRVMPGLTQKTRMPEFSSAHSTASAWVSETSPAFDALYGARKRVVFFAFTEATCTSTPPAARSGSYRCRET